MAIYIGSDASGNGNTWLPVNISTTTGYTYDLMVDSPTNVPTTATDVGGVVSGNYCVLNPLQPASYAEGSITEANTKVPASNFSLQKANWHFGVNGINSGKWYWEVTFVGGLYGSYVGVTSAFTEDGGNSVTPYKNWYGTHSARKWDGTDASPASNYYNGVSATQGYALDMTGATPVFYVYKADGTLLMTDTTIPATVTIAPYVWTTTGTWPDTYFNFGQRPFQITPPTGYKSLCTTNLTTTSTPLTAAAVQPFKNFDVSLYAGSGAPQTIVNSGFQPDLVWVKCRNVTTNNVIHDSLRGSGINRLFTELTNAESTTGDGFAGLASNGFLVNGDGGGGDHNTSGRYYVGWQWKGGGTAVTNNNGTITSQVSANTAAGFSVVAYTGNGVNAATVGHGLGATPSMIITKNRDIGTSAYDWYMNHTSLGAGQLELNQTLGTNNPATTYSNGGLAPASSWTNNVFSFVAGTGNTTNNVNNSGSKFIAFCFAAVPGYSAFGSYTGNNSTDGTFVYCGFRPRWLLMKTTSATHWVIVDSLRDQYNPASLRLCPNLTNEESTLTDVTCDFLANGFKLRTTTSTSNGALTYIYAAFAESPFALNNRAR